MNLDESDPTFCTMVNAARDEHVRLKGFAPYTADIIAMLKAALRSQGGSSDLRQAVAKMREIADFNHDNRFGRLALEAIADLEASCSPPENGTAFTVTPEAIEEIQALRASSKDSPSEFLKKAISIARRASLPREELRPPGTNPDPTMPPEGRSDANPSTEQRGAK